MNNKNNSGQSLLEVLTALGVAAVIIVALTTLAVTSLRNAQHARSQTTATKLASEGIEQVRTVRDRQGWTAFYLYVFGKCYTVDTTNWILQNAEDPPCDGMEVSGYSGYVRKIFLENESTGGEGRKITVTVTWTDSFGENTSQATTILTKWQ
ncbi:hypothetical protein A2Z23_03160 [Candidatus Curtissbacteria bacterium RBG_16_39_7]|uniref:Type II secretion system protein GspI C-terminal domain-containing protein n=1 Tax=Candidatus Curtissbacteria bacterium RBG_16_39_7 TaxID=1797707 RepID=A0A1F5G2Y3_9BACT|nr:MAG: hypothetical protein A2Z23_03160 [Candidatus Curtissbacteria bacterium RBG_16_39_7]